MNEEQAILNFFAQEENLPVALAVAEQVDAQRVQLNNRLWRELQLRFKQLVTELDIAWEIQITEDRNTPDSLVGLYCVSPTEQPLHLFPMMEQQFTGGEWRIYFGLMWHTAPSPAQLLFAPVSKLKNQLQKTGFKSNESFLAWQWTPFHPRHRGFLLRYAQQPDKLLEEVEAALGALITQHHAAIKDANGSLAGTPNDLTASLKQLRDELIG